jgi:hypothetical protein
MSLGYAECRLYYLVCLLGSLSSILSRGVITTLLRWTVKGSRGVTKEVVFVYTIGKPTGY